MTTWWEIMSVQRHSEGIGWQAKSEAEEDHRAPSEEKSKIPTGLRARIGIIIVSALMEVGKVESFAAQEMTFVHAFTVS